MPQRKRGTCSVGGCDRPHKSRGYCATHYAQHRKGGTSLGPIKARDMTVYECCSEPGCTEPVRSKRLCGMHYMRLLRYGNTDCPDRTKPDRICSFPGCDRVHYYSGFCSKHSQRARKLKRYGLTPEQYDSMLESQGGVCAICRTDKRQIVSKTNEPRDLPVDHCHKTGKVRAILCHLCNSAIGSLRDDPALARRVADYLDEHRF
jgi:hypothetical protein